MKPQNRVFFAEKGITSTSAQHLVNLATQQIETLMSKIENISFVNCEVKIPGSETIKLKAGKDKASLESVKSILETVGDLTGFVAWCMEAIKAKKDELNTASCLSVQDFIAEFPEYKSLLHTYNYSDTYTYGDVQSLILGDLDIKERCRYYLLEAKASTIGKYIHKNGTLQRAEKELLTAINNPSLVLDKNTAITVQSYTPTIDPETFQEEVLKLQARHRELEKELNKIKYDLDTKANDYSTKQRDAKVKMNEQHSLDTKKLSYLHEEWKAGEISKAKDLKIVIPEKLKEIYDYLNNL